MAEPAAQHRRVPRPPGHAWSWLQRSRPVLDEVAERLTGAPPTPGFVDELRRRFEDDPLTRDVLVSTIADVAFNGRVPSARPAGASWDRGLTWWAAALAGTDPEAFEDRRDAGEQPPLFDVAPSEQSQAQPRPRVPRQRAVTRLAAQAPERAALAARLRDLLAQAYGDSVPAAGVRDLLAELEGPRD